MQLLCESAGMEHSINSMCLLSTATQLGSKVRSKSKMRKDFFALARSHSILVSLLRTPGSGRPSEGDTP
jgi:hypothetical protein